MTRRRRASHKSISSKQSSGSRPSAKLNITEELPDAGMAKTSGKGAKNNKGFASRIRFDDDEPIQNSANAILFGACAGCPGTGVAASGAKNNKDFASRIRFDDDVHQQNSWNSFLYGACACPGNRVAASDQKEKTTIDKPKAPEVKQTEQKNVKAAPNKSMNIELHPALFSAWYMSELPREAAAAGLAVLAAHDIYDPCALMYTRNVSRNMILKTENARLIPGKSQCLRSLFIATVGEITTLLESESVIEHMKHKIELTGGTVTVVIFDPRPNSQRASKRGHGANRVASNPNLDEIAGDLMMLLQLETIVVHSPTELAQLIVHFSRAIAEEPFKRAKREVDEQANFYMEGDNKNCVTVDKDGNGLGRLWQQMIAVLPMSSLEISRSLTAEYKTPRALANELKTPEGKYRVGEVSVSRAAAPTACGRRVGPEMARKLQQLLTAEDGNMLVQ